MDFNPETASTEQIRAEITRLSGMELREENACHQGVVDFYRAAICRLELAHFRKCYEKAPETP